MSNRKLSDYFGTDKENEELTVPGKTSDTAINIGTGSRESTRKFRGYYLEHDVANAIDRVVKQRYGKKIPKGAKSDVVNDILKESLKEDGYL